MTFLGFNIERRTGNLIDQQTGEIIKNNLVPKDLFDSLVRNKVVMNEDFSKLSRDECIQKLCSVMGVDKPYDPDPSYELTSDNVKKILAIYMRFRCKIPVIIMGETGCGKTRLIKFMCKLQCPVGEDEIQNMILMKVHGGTTSQNVIQKVRDAETVAYENSQKYGSDFYTVLFFDEANTTEAIGLIKEVMCDGTMKGEVLNFNRNLKIVAACNPYRKHTQKLIKRLENAGLGYHVDADATTDRLGRVPMRRLVYRVQPLPLSMLPLVWDFGQLNVQVEELYIKQMVLRAMVDRHLPDMRGFKNSLSKILIACQEFMRAQKDECSFVSLRDVERVLTVMNWFYNKPELLKTLEKKCLYDYEDVENEDAVENMDAVEKEECILVNLSLILALAVCYRAGLRSRKAFDTTISKTFTKPCFVIGGCNNFKNIIERCQEIFLEDVDLDVNIAKNHALKENVFLMVVCMELRLPLFLVGKPGSSKSLAKTIVADVMQGNLSRSSFFKNFKQTHMVSFQCSPLSTAEGIVSTFKQCATIQKGKNLDTFVSTVVLDEIGLAEDSIKMPLKTLHPLLEDGCEGNEDHQDYKKVAFVGISNWALDPAKMNRGISVQREVPDDKELIRTAKGICRSNGGVYTKIKPILKSLGQSYLAIFEKAREKREFFGLRDFYSMVKMVYAFAENNRTTPCWHQLEHCIRRNFGGLDSINAVEVFEEHMKEVRKDEDPHEGDPDCTVLGLIKAGLSGVGSQSDSRYLLLLTENYEALGILQDQILEKFGVQTIFGSSFPRDQEYTQVCRNINRIKVCMETGNTVILLNLENLYESLYDALNQYYARFGGERYVDLGLGFHRVKCRVHQNFKLIVVAEKKVVYEKFPIPLINRLEKHFLTLDNIMSPEQSELSKKLKLWVGNMVKPGGPNNSKKQEISVEDVVMGYHPDATAAIVMKVWEDTKTKDDTKIMEDRETKKDTKIIKEMFEECKKCVLWCCTPEAILRVESSKLESEKEQLKQIYFTEQQHTDIFSYMVANLSHKGTQLFAQITTHSTLLTEVERKRFKHYVCLLNLQSFDTEQQFCKAIRGFTQKNVQEDVAKILIIQSDSQGGSTSLVKSAQYCVDENIPKDLENVNVLFIIQLDRISQQRFAGYQGGKWRCLHMDDLHTRDNIGPTLIEMQSNSLADLFKRPGSRDKSDEYSIDSKDNKREISAEESRNKAVSPDDVSLKVDTSEQESITETPVFTDEYILQLIQSCVQAAVGRVKDDKNVLPRSTQRVSIILSLLDDCESRFSKGMISMLSHLMGEKQNERETYSRATKWLTQEACKADNINKTGTFRKACYKYLEEKITPILAGTIAYIDKNLNLDIMNIGSDWKQQVWLDILQKPKVCGLKYTDMISTKKMEELHEFVVQNTGYGQQRFESAFPFSWLFFNLVETTIKTCIDQHSAKGEDIMKQTVNIIENNELLRILDDAVQLEDQRRDMFQSYTKDFIVMMYAPKDEFTLMILLDVIEKAIRQKNFILENLNVSEMLAAVHYAHTITQYRVQHIMEIVHVWPDVIHALTDAKIKGNPILNQENMTEDVLSLVLLMEFITPRDDLKTPDKTREWHYKISTILPVAERILEYSDSERTGMKELEYSECCKHHLTHIRFKWTRITTVALFKEHFSLPNEPSTSSDIDHTNTCKVLWNMLPEETDMRTLTSIKSLERFLTLLNKGFMRKMLGDVGKCEKCETTFESAPIELPCQHKICQQCKQVMDEDEQCPKCHAKIPAIIESASSSIPKETLDKLNTFRKQCDSFLMTLVSKLCFVSTTAPEGEVIQKLMGFITVTTSQAEASQHVATKPMSVFKAEIDRTPVCRLFLLKLLTRKSSPQMQQYLDDYFKQQADLIKQGNPQQTEADLVQFSSLVSYCKEDVYYEKAGEQTGGVINLAIDNLENLSYTFKNKMPSSVMEILEVIVQCRFGMVIAAKCFHQYFSEKSLKMNQELFRLLRITKDLVQMNFLWPKKFLLKQILKKYGRECYEAIMSYDEYKWIGFESEKHPVPDRYVVYGKDYNDVRRAIKLLDLDKNISKMEGVLKNIDSKQREKVFVMALHDTSASLDTESKDILQSILQEQTDFKLKEVSTSILSTDDVNPYFGITTGTSSNLEKCNLESLLCHWFLVLSTSETELLMPMYNLIIKSEAMKESFLPTMPEENQQDIQELLSVLKSELQDGETATVYRCPNGHPYVIGDCGRPYYTSTCNECNAPIGGERHRATTGNSEDDRQDRSKPGHLLGAANQRPDTAIPERSMSPPVCTIVRMLTHMSLMLGSKQNPEGISHLVTCTPPIDPGSVELYFTNHIQKDIVLLRKTLDISSDDVYLLIHLICQEISRNLPEESIDNYLLSKESRKTLEDRLKAVMDPIIQNIDSKLAEGNKIITENSNADDDILHPILYEAENPADKDMSMENLKQNPVMWRYRERITLEHFLRKFQNRSEADTQQSFKLIKLFMKERYYLEALQYLPTVIKFLYTLIQAFCRQIDRTEANSLKIGAVLKEFEGKREMDEQFDNFVHCWEMIKEKLMSYACILPDGSKLVIPEEFQNMKIDKSSKLAFLLPSTKGAGVCSYMLLEFLIRKQNDCLEEFYQCTKRNFNDVPVVEIRDIRFHHLIAFHQDKDILPLVLRNCNYSFQLGQGGEEVTYDFGGFQNQLMDRIFSRKSAVKRERFCIPIDTMLFKADSSNAVVFTTLRNIIPQVSINLATKHQICQELHKLPDICESLNNLDIANSFLKSLGEDPDASLERFMSETLKMKKTVLSQTARSKCKLKHLQCLWLMLSYEKDKLLATSNKDSFVDLDDDLKRELDDTDKDCFTRAFQKLQIEKLLVLLHLIYDTILLRISHSKDSQDDGDFREMRLGHILMGVLDAPPYSETPTELEHLDPEIFNEWPEGVLGSHAIKVWNYLMILYIKREREQVK